jgi:hypothetical protein
MKDIPNVQISIRLAWAHTAPEWLRPRSRKPITKRTIVMKTMPEL